MTLTSALTGGCLGLLGDARSQALRACSLAEQNFQICSTSASPHRLAEVLRRCSFGRPAGVLTRVRKLSNQTFDFCPSCGRSEVSDRHDSCSFHFTRVM